MRWSVKQCVGLGLEVENGHEGRKRRRKKKKKVEAGSGEDATRARGRKKKREEKAARGGRARPVFSLRRGRGFPSLRQIPRPVSSGNGAAKGGREGGRAPGGRSHPRLTQQTEEEGAGGRARRQAATHATLRGGGTGGTRWAKQFWAAAKGRWNL